MSHETLRMLLGFVHKIYLYSFIYSLHARIQKLVCVKSK